MNRITGERLGVFGDAVIAIILTVMALELPVNLHGNGQLALGQLLQAIGVYAVSFCCIASLWFQHAVLFSKTQTVSNIIVVLDLVLVFLMSLMPTFTKAMFEDIESLTIMLYGVLYIALDLLFNIISINVMHAQQKSDEHYSKQLAKEYDKIFYRHGLSIIALELIVLIVAWFQPQVALYTYVVITVLSFLLNMGERRGIKDMENISTEAQAAFFDLTPDRQRQFKRAMREYSRALNRMGRMSHEEYRANWKRLAKQLEQEYGISEDDVRMWLRYGRYLTSTPGDDIRQGFDRRGNGAPRDPMPPDPTSLDSTPPDAEPHEAGMRERRSPRDSDPYDSDPRGRGSRNPDLRDIDAHNRRSRRRGPRDHDGERRNRDPRDPDLRGGDAHDPHGRPRPTRR